MAALRESHGVVQRDHGVRAQIDLGRSVYATESAFLRGPDIDTTRLTVEKVVDDSVVGGAVETRHRSLGDSSQSTGGDVERGAGEDAHGASESDNLADRARRK